MKLAKWLCPALLSLLTACSTLQQSTPDDTRYQVTIRVAPGNEAELAAALNAVPVKGLELKPYAGLGAQEVSLILSGDKQVNLFNEQLQQRGVSVISFTARQVN